MFGYAYGTLFFFAFCTLSGLYIFVQAVFKAKEDTNIERTVRALAGLGFFVIAILAFMQIVPAEILVIK